jgi:hypothetical protein
MSQPLNEIERVHHYLLGQWIAAMRADDIELMNYYNDATDVVYELLPEREVKVHPLLAKVLDWLEKRGIKV